MELIELFPIITKKKKKKKNEARWEVAYLDLATWRSETSCGAERVKRGGVGKIKIF